MYETISKMLLRRQQSFFDTPLGQNLQDPFGSTTLQATTLWIALGSSFGSMLVITILFSLVRPHNRVVYAPKAKVADAKHQPPAIGNGVLDWVPPVRRTKEDQLVEGIGLDAAIFLRFLRMCRNMFACLALIGCLILIPVHVTTTKSLLGDRPAGTGDSITNALASVTPLNVTGLALWSHVAASYALDLIVIGFLWYNYRKVVALKRRYFQSEEYVKSLHARSVWLHDIQTQDRSDQGILQILDSVEQTAGIPRATIARNAKDLPGLIKQHDETVRELESVLAKYLKDPDKLPPNRPLMTASRRDKEHSGKVDAISYLTDRLKNLRARIRDVRARIDKRGVEPYGFASYEAIEDAHIVAYAARKKNPRGAKIRLAPQPKDLLWDNLALTKATRSRKRMMLNFWIVILTLVYIVPNAFIAAFLSNLSNLANLWPAFNTTYNSDRGLWQFVQAVLSPALLSGIYVLLPILFRRWSASSGDLTKTAREKHVIQKLYVFFVFNNLIVFSVFSTVFSFVLRVIGNTSKGEDAWEAIQDADVINALLKSLCTVSNFWFIWLIQRNLGAAIDLAQLINLVYTWFVRTFMAPTPRQKIEWTAPPPFDYASYYNWFLFYVTVALVFATVQPLVLVVTFVYFLIDAWLKKYLLLYIFVTKTESGGQFWNIIFNRILFATLMANCVAALVIKGCWGQWGADIAGNTTSYYMMGSLAPLPFILLGFKIYCNKTFADKTHYVATSRNNAEIGFALPKRPIEQGSITGRFGNPALYQKLMRPMVHKKAEQKFREIMSGDLDDQGHVDNGYGDIEMTGVRQAPLKRSETADMFEFVKDNDLDIANFKTRPDFAENHGGNGELYGRPEDLMSERSKTPASFMSDDPISRSGTPLAQPISRSGTPLAPHQRPVDLRNLNNQYDTQESVTMYNLDNESQQRLVRGAAALGHYGQMHEEQLYEQQEAPLSSRIMTMDSFRPGVRNYGQLQGHDEDEDIQYAAPRPQYPQQRSRSPFQPYRG